jgi:hypothetical protein
MRSVQYIRSGTAQAAQFLGVIGLGFALVVVYVLAMVLAKGPEQHRRTDRYE